MARLEIHTSLSPVVVTVVVDQMSARQAQDAAVVANPAFEEHGDARLRVVEPPTRSLVGVFLAAARAAPKRLALDAPDRSLSYLELTDAAESLASELRQLGVGPGDRVGVRVAGGTADLYIGILGVLFAGAAYVPVDADDPPARAEEVWAVASVCAVVSEGLRVEARGPGAGAGRPLSLDDPAWIIFTSGSTGTPNGVAVSHRSAGAFVDAEATLWTVTETDRVLAGLSVGFDASCEEMWLAWRNGAALVPAPRDIVRSGADLGPWLAERGVTVVSTVPTLAALWDESALASVRLLILGGEACPTGLAWRLARDREVWNTYGPTEATVVTTATRLRPGEPVVIGEPLPGWLVAVVDDADRPVAAGEVGELVIAGVGLGRYLDPALDAERFRPLPALGLSRAYRSGDIVRQTESGLEFVGRRDDQVKLGGRRLELGEIESRLAALPGVRVAAAAAQKTPAGNDVLVAYLVGAVDIEVAREQLAQSLPAGIAPLLWVLESLPVRSSGKLDREALPWPLPAGDGEASLALDGVAAWLADRWRDQIGPQPLDLDSDFFVLGGNSVAVAKLVSALRQRFPTVAVSDVYLNRRLGELASRLEQLGEGIPTPEPTAAGRHLAFAAAQLVGLLALLVLEMPGWVIALLAFDRLAWPAGGAPHVSWLWIALGALVFVSPPGRFGLLAAARRLMLHGLRPGRYPRHGPLALRVWFVERLANLGHVDALAGTPWAVRYARLLGARVGADARLASLPPPTGIVTIGEGATIEPDADLRGWWIDGDELVVGELRIEAGARVGARALLMPGAVVGTGAEVEPGSVVTGIVPAYERWSGSPATYRGPAGEGWRSEPPPQPAHPRLWKALYGLGLSVQSLVPLVAAVPAIVFGLHVAHRVPGPAHLAALVVAVAPLEAASFVLLYAALVALLVRAVSPLVRPGWHAEGGTAWALWFSGGLLSTAKDGPLFPFFSSLLTRPWLRLLGIRIGRRTEVATATGINRLVSYGEKSFSADDVFFAAGRSRGGWLHLEPIEIGNGAFVGNGALLHGSSRIGDRSLVGVLTTPPPVVAEGTSWLGAPALELPRIADHVDTGRSTEPPPHRVAARACVEFVRILLPTSASLALVALVYVALEYTARKLGLLGLIAVTPAALASAGVVASLATIAVKWLLIGRYRAGDHPLWSFFVWRDEIVNSCQEQLAGVWLLNLSLATPILPLYLRAMGAHAGRDVWCETLAITEFDLVSLGDGSVLNRGSCIQTHLFHDRLMRIGPCRVGAGASIGPNTAVLPDTTLGEGTSVGGRSVVLRGEELPARTRWHGAPVVPAFQ